MNYTNQLVCSIAGMQKETRNKIVQKCYEAIRDKGFLELRTDKEIKRLRITKGAFYHYFPGKLDLGYAVIEEKIKPEYTEKWSRIAEKTSGIGDSLLQILQTEKNNINEKNVIKGDVLSNLMHEMASHDEEFRKKLEAVLEELVQLLQKAILAGKNAGEFKTGVDARSMAYFLIGSLQGCYSIAKTRNSKDVFVTSINALMKNLAEILFVNKPLGI